MSETIWSEALARRVNGEATRIVTVERDGVRLHARYVSDGLHGPARRLLIIEHIKLQLAACGAAHGGEQLMMINDRGCAFWMALEAGEEVKLAWLSL